MGTVNFTHAAFTDLLCYAKMRNTLTNHSKLPPLPWHLMLTFKADRGNTLFYWKTG